MIRYAAAAALAAAALLLTACSAGGQPLAVGTVQEGVKACAEAPNVAPSVGVPAWDSQMGWAFDWYYNSSASPVEIESASLIDSHGLILHGAIVYEMRHSENPLIQVDGWGRLGQDADPAMWARPAERSRRGDTPGDLYDRDPRPERARHVRGRP